MSDDIAYISNNEIHIKYREDKLPININVGIDAILQINKLFGPTIAASLRITSDLDRGWIVEREDISTGLFKEIITIDFQIDSDFPEDNQQSTESK